MDPLYRDSIDIAALEAHEVIESMYQTAMRKLYLIEDEAMVVLNNVTWQTSKQGFVISGDNIVIVNSNLIYGLPSEAPG